ncbi:MAG TPA: hypothetical protein VEL28_02010 [Candidatus Binatia bacterium]|nr:hypothetical protein [Candidatus Binatia bacterium]
MSAPNNAWSSPAWTYREIRTASRRLLMLSLAVNPFQTLFVLLALAVKFAAAATLDGLTFEQESSLPFWVLEGLRSKASNVTACAALNPFYQRADFDGDGRADYSVIVCEKLSGKRGIGFVHAKGPTVIVLGAGAESPGSGSDDYSWMDAWQVFERGRVSQGMTEEQPPTLRGDALLIEKTSSASAILWWDGDRYQWYQQGD